MIVGLTGRNAAGKGVVAEYLKSKGFYYHSLSDVIRKEISSRGQEPSRQRMIAVGNEMRQRHGPSHLAQVILQSLEPDKNYVIDSIRNTSEINALRQHGNFTLLSIEADPRVRFERLQARARPGDPPDFVTFAELEKREESQDAEKQQLIECEKAADYHILNNGSLKDLRESVSRILQTTMKNLNRPGWDEYFMSIAKVAALRSNCIKRKVAAILVREKRIISTGYNGTPRGTLNCYEGGCPRCNNLADSGTHLDECLCSHGEENAITQAAYHGVSVKGSTLYSTFAPCLMCTKMIINSGIVEVVYNQDYPLNDTAFKLFDQAGVKCRQIVV